MSEQTGGDILAALRAPFHPRAVGYKAQMVKNNRALAVPYLDARDVMQRLDAVLGPANWRDSYTDLADGNVRCRLEVRIGGEWVHREDVGGPSEQPDGGDRLKSAYSDALKRAAVKLGVGRYVYWLPTTWCDYDAATKQIARLPDLPKWAMPGGSGMPPEQAEQPTTAPADPPSGKTPKPAAQEQGEDAPEFADARSMNVLLAKKGKTWAEAVTWLNKECGAAYVVGKAFRYTDMAAEHRRKLVAAVGKMPDAPQQQKAG